MARLLLVDDNPLFRQMLCRALRAAGHDVIWAEDGEAALRNFSSEGPFDVVITDIVMPNREGIGTILELTARSDVPIIAMSGGGRSIDSDDALESARLLGASATLSKPFPLTTLLAEVDRLVGT